MNAKIAEIVNPEDNMKSSIIRTGNGFSVNLEDVDSGLILLTVFKFEKNQIGLAMAKAIKIAGIKL